jgi:hypothetical protein
LWREGSCNTIQLVHAYAYLISRGKHRLKGRVDPLRIPINGVLPSDTFVSLFSTPLSFMRGCIEPIVYSQTCISCFVHLKPYTPFAISRPICPHDGISHPPDDVDLPRRIIPNPLQTFKPQWPPPRPALGRRFPRLLGTCPLGNPRTGTLEITSGRRGSYGG